MPVPEVVRLARQIAAALAAAHQKGVIHRDLKPDNVMIVADSSFPGGERTKLLDFGIAKLRLEYQGEGEGQQIQTRAGVMMGTPLYMSPEQCRNASDVDDKADVYSLGIIIYRMLAGRPPFNAAGTGELMAMHIYMQPPPLVEADASLPEPLTQLVHRMLAKNRTERPSMAEVAQELDRIGTVSMSLPVVPSRSSLPTVPAPDDGATVVSDPSSAQRTPTPTPSASGVGKATSPVGRTPARRSPLVSLAVSVVLLALAGGIYLLVTHRRTPKDATNQTSTAADAGTPPDASDAAPPQKLVHWQIESSPAGAEVIRIDDNKSQGQTPLRIEQPAQPGEVKLELRLKGYAPLPFAISGEEDAKPAVFNLVAEKAGKRGKKPRGPKPPAQ
jgi:serine/threonine-protein kinase